MASLDATITFGHAQILMEAVDEVDIVAQIFSVTCLGAGSSFAVGVDASIDIVGGNSGVGNVQFSTLNGDVMLSAGGADGDVILTCSGTGTVNVTGQIVMNQPQLARSSVAYTNNAAANVATLNNSPTAGNPTKWIPINDNGTIRNIPAW